MPACNLRRLRVTDQFGAVGWGVVMRDQPKESSNVEGSSYRIGVVKYFTVKWRRYYIQFIDASAPELEALRPLKLPSLRDAKELAESLAISLTHGDIQLSRSATDRHWLDPEDMQIYVVRKLWYTACVGDNVKILRKFWRLLAGFCTLLFEFVCKLV
ncbi:hypothetical protein Pmar_PMAR008077 [Perkinsus marinus ATCC 50983]|uniref:Uncharacterized protein n=1 Tax=Perkinsus marinus (strain ATCC 50983 / TXsc) TaxID=423536 RepID=C5KD81_PERM5|nr:hypothetical protein Pmar_PMAR008077 [Perkinsus marinus ATCC 50983]EER17514.1 hypothetical protein Pmar_PMAR008077 [Perkinsus marinus ATCC 50983]|eukprot:XP_002785718.1 hypothetical protein Pmar_PMAR008077 [Perkinsus marinus ATCC 50983]